MQRPILAALAVLVLVVPRARAQGSATDTTGGVTASFGVPRLQPPRHPALAPGGRLGPRATPDQVAAAWEASLRASLASRAGSAPGATAGPLFAAPPPSPTAARFTSPFGPYADLGMSLNLRFELKADQFRNLKCTSQEQQLALSGCNPGFPTITPNPQYAIRTVGVVGQRLHINVDFDSQREFDANNNLQVWYEGLEDEALRRVEAGNVTFQAPPSRFISAAIPANNFGVQAVGQLGAMEVRGIYAQQKGNVVRDRFYNVGETTTQLLDREARDLEFAAGRLFFAVEPLLLPAYPAVDVLALDAAVLPDSLRVGSLRVYRSRVIAPGTAANQNIGGVKAVACAPAADATGCVTQRAGPFRWEVLEPGRDYYVDQSGVWFALNTPLNVDDYLAVSYVPAGQPGCGQPFRCIGTFPTVANPDTSVVDTLRLVYDPRSGATAAVPSFRYELRNAYRVGGQELTRETVELVLMVNQRERALATNETYLAALGMAVSNDANRFDQYNRLFPRVQDPQQGAPLRDYFVVFPHLQPFGDATRLQAAERNDSLYRTPRPLLASQGPPSVFALRLRANVSASADRSTLSLNTFEIREGSEKLYLRNQLLQRGNDYTIDYTTGQVTFTNPDSLFAGGVSQVRVQFEERAAFAIAPTSIFGMAARYDLGQHGAVHFTSLFQQERSAFNRPPLGFEPSSSFIGGLNADLRFQPEWLTRAMDALPGVATETPSFVTVAGEVAISKPTPNQAGQAYLEEFEADAARFLPLSENAWRWGSMPSSSRGAEPYGISPAGFAPFEAATLTWQNVPYNPNGQPVLFYAQQIDPTIQVTGTTQNAEAVLWLLLKPDTVLGTANVHTGAPNWVRPPAFAPRWRSLTLPLATGGIDLSRVEFLEFWVWEDNHRIARANRAALLIDVGAVFEDALSWVPDSFTVQGADTTYYGQRYIGQGRLDSERDPVTQSWNAAFDDDGILGDRVVDSIYNATDGSTVDTLPLCSLTQDGRLMAYGFGDLRSRCGRNNGSVDTEDQDGDFALDSATGVRTTEDFVRFVFPIGDERYFVRDGGMITVRDSLGNPDGAAGWRLYRIPFRFDTLQVGAPNLRQAQAVRLTIVSPQTAGPGQPDPQIYFALSRVQFSGSTWLKRADSPQRGLAGTIATAGEVVASVISTEDVDLGYEPPPGVGNEADRRDAGLQLGTQQINEKALRLLARGLAAAERAEAYLRFTTEGDKNFLRYKTLRVWARGRGPGWDDRDLEFFVKVGKNEHNFYLYHTPVRTTAWEPEVVVELERWIVLRAQIEQDWLAGAPATVGAGCPDSTFLPLQDSAFVRCDGPYIAYIRDPGTAPPNLAQVQEIATGILRVTERVFVDIAELWVDDIRLGDVVDDIGIAGALDVAVSAAGVADLTFSVSRRDGQFRQLGDDPSYVTDDAWSAGGTLRLERFLPERWGLSLPLTARVASTASTPFYISRTDIRADVLQGLRTPESRAESYSLALRRVRRSSTPLGRWLLDASALSASLARGSTRSDFARATSSAYALSYDYGITPAPAMIGVFGGRLRWSPTAIRFRSNLTSSDAERFAYQVQVAQPGDTAITPALSVTRGWRNTGSIDFLPATGLQFRVDASSFRDLRDYGDSTSMGQVIGSERATLFGMDVGFETHRSLNSLIGITTQVGGGWLRPRATLASTFTMNRDPNAPNPVRDAGDTAGAFHIPTAFSNQRRTDLGAQLELRGLAAKTLGDSARVTKLLARLQTIDVTFGRVLASTYNRTGLDPTFGYSLALIPFDEFRQQDGTLAVSASDNTSLSARTGVTLPLRLRVTVDYHLTRGETWTLRTGEQVPVRTRNQTWPSGTLSWQITPRRLLSRVITSLSMQASYRETSVRTEQPSLGGTTTGTAASVNTGDDRSLTPSLTITWLGGVLTTFDASAVRSDQLTSGNHLRGDRDTRNATMAFSFQPRFLSLQSAVRSTLRYSLIGNVQCIQSAGQTQCVPYVNSRQSSVNFTMDTDLPPSIGAGLQFSYILNEERQVNRKTSQFVLTAFISFNTTVGQIQ